MLALFLAAMLFSNATNLTNSTNSILLSTTINSTSAQNQSVLVLAGNFTGDFTGNFSFSKAKVSRQFNASSLIGIVLGSQGATFSALVSYGYVALFLLMFTDSVGLPPPSEFVLPPAGYLAKLGYVDFGLAFYFIMVANIIGISIDYMITYPLGENFFKKRKSILGFKMDDVLLFKGAFIRFGPAIVFVAKLIPIMRTLIGFVAGFFRMPSEDYYFFAITGAMVYNYILMVLGYFLISENYSIVLIFILFAFPLVMYIFYNQMVKKYKKRITSNK